MPYLDEMITQFWDYRVVQFPGNNEFFEEAARRGNRPPVFNGGNAFRNILTDPNLDQGQQQRLIGLIPPEKQHRWFRSMKSSQALAQSVFGTLEVMGKARLLCGLRAFEGQDNFPFQADQQGQASISLEVEVTHLGEPRRTSMDVVFKGESRVAIECKLTEQDVGHCSRPRLNAGDPQYCNGNYEIQHMRLSRCALTEIGVRYWDGIPSLFHLDAGINHTPCPLRHTYQLIRNVLAVCTLAGGSVVLLFDERNPAFRPGGTGDQAFTQVRAILREPGRLQRCTWQDLVNLLRGDEELNWLTQHLRGKYGF